MAISDALAWRLNSGGTADDLYSDIRTFLGTNPDAAATQAAMRQYGISGEDVAAATGGASGGLLSGNILAGASWNSSNTALQNQLTEATGQATSNYAVAGSTTTDTLNQLNTYLAGGGQFDPNATVYLQAGGVDFITGVDKAVVKDNLNQIVKTLGDQGVNVVLTGSPYAKSVQDVIDNKFDPKVDQIYTDVAKANSNVALVGTQGEILQNKALLVDALHTNAEGTAVYNQSVIDALSQFKHEVPSSTPQAIAQVQKTNTVATTPAVITQAAASPVVAQSLATQSVDSLIKAGNLNPTQIANSTGVSVGEILTKVASTVPQGQTVTLGDTIIQPEYRVTGSGETQEIGNLETIYTSKTTGDPNYRAPVGSEIQQYGADGTFIGTGKTQKTANSFLGGLAEAFNDPVVQAAFLGLGGGGFLGSQLGLTGSTAQAVGTGLFKGGAAAAGGADIGEALKVGLLSGGLVYGGNALNNYLTTGTTAEPSITERQFAIADAKNLASQGLSTTQIADTLAAGGYNEAIIDRAISSLTGSTASTLPTPGAVNVIGTATPAINAGLLSGLVVPKTTLSTPAASTAISTPVTQGGTVNVTGTAQPQMVDQATLNLVASQLASNLGTNANLGATNNLANLQVTADRPATTQEITNAILATVPNVTLQQAQTQAQVLITSGQNLTTNDLISAVSSVSPNITNSVAEQIITSTNSTVIPSIVNSLASVAASTIPASSIPTQTITDKRQPSITSDLTAAAIPLIQPSSPLTLPEIPRQPTTPTTSNPLLNTAASLGLSSLLGSAGANLISGGLGTAGNLLQMQTSREAAQRAQAMIDAETKAAKDAAQFRPIGMTTRFGTSQFGFDPVTGRLSSAGYNLTPDVKAQQDRFMALSNQGLTQAEQAQSQFAPLQTGAQRLFGLGNQYLAQSPEAVAQNYLNQQMSLLQPGRELELANLQNKLQQQGRGGLSVAQGGTMGATTPELQALYNARAAQEAQLAANAQQAGQRDVLFGAGLLGQGSQAMGQYYGGQQAAYAPYTAALGQAQTLETLGQQPYNMGVNLGQIGSQAGFNVGQLGLKGAQLSANLATSADATRNLLAQGLTAAGNPNAMFGQAIGGLFGAGLSGLQSAFSQTPLGSSGFGTGLAYGNQDLGLYL